MSQVTETRIASVFMDKNGIVTILMKDCGVIDEDDVMDLNLVIRHTTEHKQSLKLVIASVGLEMNKKAKLMAKKEDNISKTKARAIVVSNKLKASLLNFLKSFENKNYPQQFFTDKEKAYDWLLTFK